jgi:hypothetical protein
VIALGIVALAIGAFSAVSVAVPDLRRHLPSEKRIVFTGAAIAFLLLAIACFVVRRLSIDHSRPLVILACGVMIVCAVWAALRKRLESRE